MRKRIVLLAILLTSLLALALAPAAYAKNGQPPTGTVCPPGFDELHLVEDPTDHDNHIGLKSDLNGDGYLCVKHLKNGLHVHVDNVIR